MKKIVYTKHALKKFDDLAELNIYVTEKMIDEIIKNPLYIDEISDYPKKIAMGKLDERHILRIVYREENDILVIITFYPAAKGRYL